MRLLSNLLTLLIALVVVWFAVANRHDVALTLDPFPLSFSAPLYLPVLLAALIGLIAGGIISWRAGGDRRTRLRLAERQRDELRRDLGKAERDAAEQPHSRAVTKPSDAAED